MENSSFDDIGDGSRRHIRWKFPLLLLLDKTIHESALHRRPNVIHSVKWLPLVVKSTDIDVVRREMVVYQDLSGWRHIVACHGAFRNAHRNKNAVLLLERARPVHNL